MRRVFPTAILALAITLPWVARADEHELYLQLELAPAWLEARDPTSGATSIGQLGGAAEVAAYFGLTHSLHLGVSAFFSGTPNVTFPNQTLVVDSAGSTATGTLYETPLSAGAAALLVYRANLSWPLVPIARLELGGVWGHYTNLLFNPDGTQLGLPQGALDGFALTARVTVGLEWRLADHWSASIGISGRYNLGLDLHPALNQAELTVPVTVSYVLW